MELIERIDKAIDRITSGDATMRVPVDDTDPDVVLADCRKLAERVSSNDLLATYKITPLKWRGEIDEKKGLIKAETPFGSYTVSKVLGDMYMWGYCFDVYYDEDNFRCESIVEGRFYAERDWVRRITGALSKCG